MSERTWQAWAHDTGDKDKRYCHMGSKRYVELHGMSYPIVAVIMQEDAAGVYWGWLESDDKIPSMIWPTESQFRMCFPYGFEKEVERGRGEVVRLSVSPAE